MLRYPHKKTRLTDISITDSPLGPKGANLHNDLVVLTDQAQGNAIHWINLSRIRPILAPGRD